MSSVSRTSHALANELDVAALRRQFPILSRKIQGHPLAYFDSAGSAQRPIVVTEAVQRCYNEYYANVHRGVHTLSQESSHAYEDARRKVARLIGAREPEEIVFCRGTTEGINLVAQSYGRRHVSDGDEVVVTVMEHHSNIVPWQLLCEERGATLRVAPVDDRGDLILEELEALLSERTRVVAVTHVSNTLGTENPIRSIATMAHQVGAVLVVDGAQGVPHLQVDVQGLGCDFYAFSGHKTYGPSGTGALYGRRELLDSMPPWQGGGGMIRSVSFEGTSFAEVPHRFEAGTPNIAGTIGFGVAAEFLQGLGYDAIGEHESRLLSSVQSELVAMPGVRVIGRPRSQVGVLSFVVEGVHAHDVGTFLDQEGVAVRVGHHCTQPLMERFGIAATSRVSLAAFNTDDEVARLLDGVRRVVEFFS